MTTITVYTMKGCGNCTRLKNLLDKYNAKYRISEAERPNEKPQINYCNKYFNLWFVGYKECKDFVIHHYEKRIL